MENTAEGGVGTGSGVPPMDTNTNVAAAAANAAVATDVEIDKMERLENEIKAPTSTLLPSNLDPFSRRLYVRQMLKNMPKTVLNRVTLLKNLQVDYHKLQVDYYREIFNLEKKYHAKYEELYEKRAKIITGELDPPAQEPNWKADPDDLDNDADLTELVELLKDAPQYPEDVKGVPDFWLNIFRNSDIVSQIVFDHDVPVLKFLRDIKIHYNDENSYTLEFHFDENEYFHNHVLTKQYFLKNTVDEEYPFGFEGLEIFKCKGCSITWKQKMNLTIKSVRKREKHRESGIVRTVLKQVPRNSFFNFFNPPDIEADKLDGIDEETQQNLRIDFEIGHFLREEIIPKAVLYYTGDIMDDDEDDDDSYESDDESAGGEPDEGNLDIERVAEILKNSLRS